MYAFTFLMAGFVPSLVLPNTRALMLANFIYWVPDVIAIVVALGVAAFTFYKGAPLSTVMNVGLVFLVLSNFGIAIAEYINPSRLDNNGWLGLSWVAVWTPLYTVVVPTRPIKALIATVLSVSSVPLVIGWMIGHRQDDVSALDQRSSSSPSSFRTSSSWRCRMRVSVWCMP